MMRNAPPWRGLPAAVLLLALSCGQEPVQAPAVASTSMSTPSSPDAAQSCQDTLVVHESMRLNPDCTYKLIRIEKPNVVLDCAGATIDVGYEGRHGIVIAPRRFGELVHDVVVKNCTVRRARRDGIFIGIEGCDRDKLSVDEEERYRIHPQRIRLENVTVTESANSGLYIDDYVQHVVVTGSRFERNAKTAIYITHDARRNEIRNSHFERNGHSNEITPRAGKGKREAIAIDSAQENLITGNVFRDNYAGAVFLYRNCWEKPHQHCQVERKRGASGNIITNNEIQGGGTGIWIAARQRISADTSDCGRRPDPSRGIFNDDAKNNRVEGNIIRRTGIGIVVEDDRNVITGNRIEHPHKTCIIAGSKQRVEQFGVPVRGLKVTGNRCKIGTRKPEDAGIRLVPGTEGLVQDNQVTP